MEFKPEDTKLNNPFILKIRFENKIEIDETDITVYFNNNPLLMSQLAGLINQFILL